MPRRASRRLSSPFKSTPMPKYCGLKTLLALDFSRESMALPYAKSRLRLAVSFWWFAFREVTISRTALFDREPDITGFYARSSAGKYEPNVDELRLLFGRAPQLSDRIRDFRFD